MTAENCFECGMETCWTFQVVLLPAVKPSWLATEAANRGLSAADRCSPLSTDSWRFAFRRIRIRELITNASFPHATGESGSWGTNAFASGTRADGPLS